MENLEKMLELADAEFASVAKNGKFRSREEIDSVYKLMDIVKDVHEIWKCEDEMSEGNMSYDGGGSYRGNMRGGSYRGGNYDGGSYDGGNSMARGRGRNARRDSMGRYSRDGGGNSYRYDGYSRGGDKQEYVEHLRELAEDAPDETTRQNIQRMIQQLEQQ